MNYFFCSWIIIPAIALLKRHSCCIWCHHADQRWKRLFLSHVPVPRLTSSVNGFSVNMHWVCGDPSPASRRLPTASHSVTARLSSLSQLANSWRDKAGQLRVSGSAVALRWLFCQPSVGADVAGARGLGQSCFARGGSGSERLYCLWARPPLAPRLPGTREAWWLMEKPAKPAACPRLRLFRPGLWQRRLRCNISTQQWGILCVKEDVFGGHLSWIVLTRLTGDLRLLSANCFGWCLVRW